MLKSSQVDRQLVAKAWVYRGLCDLFFGFENDDPAFENYAVFSRIMALEKFLKAVLLFSRYAEYEDLAPEKARHQINYIAKCEGHDFRKMLDKIALIAPTEVCRIENGDFDGYLGEKLVEAVTKGYMETRYPVPTPIFQKFPTDSTNVYHDPLSSSGVTKFVYAVCNTCFDILARDISSDDMRRQFDEKFAHKSDSLRRFYNLFWGTRDTAK